MLLVGIVVKLMTDLITPATFGNFTLTLFVLVLSFVRILKKAAAYGATAFAFMAQYESFLIFSSDINVEAL